MSTELAIPNNFGAVSTVFHNAGGDDELAAGISSGFAVMSYRGKVWRVKHRGDEQMLMREDGDGPKSSIDVVVVRAAPNLSKIWYEKGFEEGSTAQPDCWSSNGMTPDTAASKKQSATCATCPRNMRGSRMTPSGKPGKECSDSKRLAIIPLHANDVDDETYDGPLLLRVPAASLSDMKKFSDAMLSKGFRSYTFGMRLSFDPNEAYPKFVFRALRPLSDHEAQKVMALREDPRTMRIIEQSIEHTQASEPQPDESTTFLQPEAPKAAPTQTSKPVEVKPVETKTEPAKTRTKAAAPKPEPVVEADDEDADPGTELSLEEELKKLGF